jgi:hypothetical protein
MVRQHRDEIRVERAFLVLARQLLETMRLARDENRDALSVLLSVQTHGDFHRQLGTDRLELEHELVEADG